MIKSTRIITPCRFTPLWQIQIIFWSLSPCNHSLPRAQNSPTEVTNHFSFSRPYLHFPIFERENFLLIVQEDESFRCLKISHFLLLLRPGIVNDHVSITSLDHDFVIELLEKFDFLRDLGELELK